VTRMVTGDASRTTVDARRMAPDCEAHPGSSGAARVRPNYARTSFLNAIRCGWSASAPFRFFRSSMYDW
jgi:hypothetical protein